MKTLAGFTLLELMVTVSVAAILLTVGIPGMQAFIKNNRRASEVNEMVATLQVARSESVARNKIVAVCSSTDDATCAGSETWDQGWIVFVDEDNDGVRDDPGVEELLRANAGPEDMTVRATFESIRYRSNGRVITAPDGDTSGDITFCDNRGTDEARVVQIDISGRPESADEPLEGSLSCPG